uniref:Cl2158_1 n=1 Tax=Arundo donax TaxID=35708 RepID=A0A0A9G5L1_ARUDO
MDMEHRTPKSILRRRGVGRAEVGPRPEAQDLLRRPRSRRRRGEQGGGRGLRRRGSSGRRCGISPGGHGTVAGETARGRTAAAESGRGRTGAGGATEGRRRERTGGIERRGGAPGWGKLVPALVNYDCGESVRRTWWVSTVTARWRCGRASAWLACRCSSRCRRATAASTRRRWRASAAPSSTAPTR